MTGRTPTRPPGSAEPRPGTGRAILLARVVFVSLVGYGGYLLGESVDGPVPWFVWAVAGLMAGVAVVYLEQAARHVPMPRLFVSAICVWSTTL